MTTKPRRSGPGRRFGPPPMPADKKRVKMCVTIPPWLAEWVKAQGMPISEVVEAALVGHYGLKKPEGKAE